MESVAGRQVIANAHFQKTLEPIAFFMLLEMCVCNHLPPRNRLLSSQDDMKVVVGDILASNCFYREEPNDHGAVLVYDGYTPGDVKKDAEEMRQQDIAAVEMEATAMAGICGPDQADIPAADICGVVDPIGIPIKSSKEELKQFSANPEKVVFNYITSREELFT